MNERQDFWFYLKNSTQVVLLVHEKPDGDCLGSALALGMGLKGRGLQPVLYLPEALAAKYCFLPGQDLLKVQEEIFLQPGTPVIALDCADEKRLVYPLPKDILLMNIDHHVSNNAFGHYNLLDVQAAATAEIIYQLLLEKEMAISPEMATCLYVALSTDTGSFSYSNTTAQTLRIASELVTLGCDLELIRQHLFERRSLLELVLFKTALDRLTLSPDGLVISCALPYGEMESKSLLQTDTEEFVGMLRATEGVEAALLFKELQPGKIKISFRSKSFLNVNTLAQHYGGGGHPRAAGCTVQGELEQVKQDVLKKTLDLIKGEEGFGRGN